MIQGFRFVTDQLSYLYHTLLGSYDKEKISELQSHPVVRGE